MNAQRKKLSGFTIVELLIVVVVIAILAAITIIAYNGIQTRAIEASVKSDLVNAEKQLDAYKTLNGTYPQNLSALNNGNGFKTSNGTTLQYSPNTGTNPPEYYLSAVNKSISFYTSHLHVITAGVWTGHSSDGVSAPTRVGYQAINAPTNTTLSFTVPGSVSNGSWMVLVFAYSDSMTITAPAGWTTFINRETTGTLRTSLYAKIREASDGDTYTFSYPMGGSTGNAVLMWGDGSAPVSAWTMGVLGRRDTTGTSSTNVAAGVTTTNPKSLVITMSTERTTATETDITSVSGATKWFFIPQPDGSRIQSIATTYYEQTTTGTTPNVVFTYPNTQATNGLAVQLAIPPAN